MRALWCLLLVFVAGCAGIVGKEDTATVPAPPPGYAYQTTMEFVPTPAAQASTTTALGSTSGISQDVGDAAFGIAAWASKLPLIGWMFGARVAERASKNLAGKGENGPITPAVFITAIESGRIVKITYTPVPIVPAATK